MRKQFTPSSSRTRRVLKRGAKHEMVHTQPNKNAKEKRNKKKDERDFLFNMLLSFTRFGSYQPSRSPPFLSVCGRPDATSSRAASSPQLTHTSFSINPLSPLLRSPSLEKSGPNGLHDGQYGSNGCKLRLVARQTRGSTTDNESSRSTREAKGLPCEPLFRPG